MSWCYIDFGSVFWFSVCGNGEFMYLMFCVLVLMYRGCGVFCYDVKVFFFNVFFVVFFNFIMFGCRFV